MRDPGRREAAAKWERDGVARAALIGLAVALAASGCDRNTEPYVPGEKPSQPDLARIFPAPESPDGPGGAAVAQAPAAQPGGATRGNRLPGDTAPATASPIRGTVRISSELDGAQPNDAVLFVIARSGAATAGPPLAVVRIPGPRFPLDFEIGPDDVMIPSLSFEGEIRLSARLDSDGNATTRRPGDLQGQALESLAPGALGVEIVLDQRI